MGGHRFDKKTQIRQAEFQRSADSLSKVLKLNLRGSVLLYREGKNAQDYSLYVPEDKYLQVTLALKHQFHVHLRGTELHIYNGDDIEVRYKIDLPDVFGIPIADAFHSKTIPFTTARGLAEADDPNEIIQWTVTALAHERSGI